MEIAAVTKEPWGYRSNTTATEEVHAGGRHCPCEIFSPRIYIA